MKKKKIKPIPDSERSEKPVSMSELHPTPEMLVTDDPFRVKGTDRVEVKATRIALWLPDGTRWEFFVSPHDGSLEVMAVAAPGISAHQIYVMPRSSNTLAMVLK